MRKLIYILPLLLVIGCEVIDKNEQTIPISLPQSSKTLLLTEFSGIGCVNCPLAQEEARRLSESFKEQLVVVEMHPKSNPFTDAIEQYDYTTDAADEYYLYFGGTTSTPFPTGVINFEQHNGVFFTDYSLWGANIYNELQKTADTDFLLETTTNLQTRQVTIAVTDLELLQGEEQKIILWLTEDSIIGPQLMPDGTLKSDYAHNHILRQAITPIWGVNAEELNIQYSVPQEYNISNCSVVTLLLKADKTVLATHISRLKPLSDMPFTLSADEIGVISKDTTVCITQSSKNSITGKKEMEIKGMLAYNGVLAVDINRDDSTVEDQFCCSGQCINTNYKENQEMKFQVNGLSQWYAHFYAEKQGDYTIKYKLNSKGINPITLTVIYKYY